MEREYRFESEIQADILVEFGSGKPMRIFRNNVGLAYPISTFKTFVAGIWSAIKKKPFNILNVTNALSKIGRPVKYSVTGSADILGILKGGRAIAIEVKMPGENLDPDQITWRDMFIRFGGLHIVARSVGDVYDALADEGIQCR